MCAEPGTRRRKARKGSGRRGAYRRPVAGRPCWTARAVRCPGQTSTYEETLMLRRRYAIPRMMAVGTTIAFLLGLGLPARGAAAQGTMQVVASNLDNPRGLSFGPD